MGWKTEWRSFYYETAEEPADLLLEPQETALLVIDLQNTYLEVPEAPEDAARWQPFLTRMQEIVLPNTRAVQDWARGQGIEVIHARIACLKQDGRDRSLSQKKPGFNHLLLPKDRADSQIIETVGPLADEIVVTKTTDSALTGTNLRMVLHNMGIKRVICAGIFTDQCISSTVRSLADESFDVIVLEDCCAAATRALHEHELRVINMIYCQVMAADELKSLIV
ncbi:isochorismatase family cysteine hydrolase [Celeribacter baekdonensis]|uniref:Amidase n=1 Tax=Celeribacter baekdonensis TaxID=875171 RepID=A0A2R4M0T6_9RHOB|nr:isochorismatase family cysteine hydrolase [Celeribacter baekdonensis]AVW90738.1 amidase [Celeribacter baekdonensis]|tara:strand:- start:87685 stop:88353 length:669 start_codon:yes stop_codon:yes gene_type:complete